MTRSSRTLGLTMVGFALLAGLVCVGWAGADVKPAAPGRPGTGGARTVVVPLDILSSRHLVVRVRVNTKGPYPVLLDTGSPLVMLSTKVGRECGLSQPSSPAGTGGQPAPPAANRVVLRSLAVEDAEATGVPALIIDHPLLKRPGGEEPAPEGVVGYPFFSRFRCVIDYQARTLTVTPNGYEPPDVLREIVRHLQTPETRTVLAPAGQWGLVVRKGRDDESPGVAVDAVTPGGAADAAGLKAGDRLLTIDGRWTDGVSECYAAAALARPNRPVRVGVRRGGAEKTVVVTPRAGL